MKKIFALLLCLLLAFAFAACGEAEDPTQAPTVTVTEPATDEITTAEPVSEESTSETATEEFTTQEATEEIATEEAATEEMTAQATATQAETATVIEQKNATVTVSQEEDIAGEYGTVFNASADEYAFYAVFRTDVTITDVKVLGLTFVDADENGVITFDKEVLHTVDEIGPDFNLSVHLTADGTIPAYGIAYTDSDGTEKSFSVNMSGEDGSLYLAEIE
ncbi:MAG: hypothetical protein IJC45_08555 [Clostridia bacterium]|nr:hypothetical protein [Clostridia bacterium]